MGFPFGGNGTPLSFSELQTEFGGANPISMSEYYRNGAYVTDNNVNVPTSGVLAFSDFYGASKKFTATVSATGTNLTAATILTAAGWNTESFFEITINVGVTAYATSTSNGGLTVSGSYPYGFSIINNGVIMGMGGDGGEYASINGKPGGPALSITNSYLTAQMSVTNNVGAYIAGGGGGGGAMNNAEIEGGGGGGAGGGDGGITRQTRGGYYVGSAGNGGGLGASGTSGGASGASGGGGGGSGGGAGSWQLDGISSTRDGGGSGGGGGRILPGTGGLGGTSGSNGGNGGSAGAAGGAGTNGSGNNGGGGGGGGWGAAGGLGQGANGTTTGGAGGYAIAKNGSTVPVTNSGTIYGTVA